MTNLFRNQQPELPINLDDVPDWSVILVYDHGVAFNEQLQQALRRNLGRGLSVMYGSPCTLPRSRGSRFDVLCLEWAIGEREDGVRMTRRARSSARRAHMSQATQGRRQATRSAPAERELRTRKRGAAFEATQPRLLDALMPLGKVSSAEAATGDSKHGTLHAG